MIPSTTLLPRSNCQRGRCSSNRYSCLVAEPRQPTSGARQPSILIGRVSSRTTITSYGLSPIYQDSIAQSAELWGGLGMRYGIDLFQTLRFTPGVVFGLSAISSAIGQEA